MAATNATYSSSREHYSNPTFGINGISAGSAVRQSFNTGLRNSANSNSSAWSTGFRESVPTLTQLKSQMDEKRVDDAMKLFDVLMATYPDIDAAEARSLAQQF